MTIPEIEQIEEMGLELSGESIATARGQQEGGLDPLPCMNTGVAWMQVSMLAEIARQLAILNEREEKRNGK